MWSPNPPTYDEWMSAKNHGTWWIKFKLCSEETEIVDGEELTWPEVWHVSIVTITCSYPKGQMLNREAARLHAHGPIAGRFDLDDPEKTRGVYWQPVKPPEDDDRKSEISS